MFKNDFMFKTKGQTMIEYTMVVGIIVLIMLAMGPMLKRGIQSLVRVVADQVGNQQDSDQDADKTGHLDKFYTLTRASIGQQTIDRNGIINYSYADSIYTFSNTMSNLGFSEDNP